MSKVQLIQACQEEGKRKARLMRYENQAIYKGIDGSTPFFKSSPFGNESLDSAPARLLPRPSRRTTQQSHLKEQSPIWLIRKHKNTRTTVNVSCASVSFCIHGLWHRQLVKLPTSTNDIYDVLKKCLSPDIY